MSGARADDDRQRGVKMTFTHTLVLLGVVVIATLVNHVFRRPTLRRSDADPSSTGAEVLGFDVGSSCDGGSDSGGGCAGD